MGLSHFAGSTGGVSLVRGGHLPPLPGLVLQPARGVPGGGGHLVVSVRGGTVEPLKQGGVRGQERAGGNKVALQLSTRGV